MKLELEHYSNVPILAPGRMIVAVNRYGFWRTLWRHLRGKTVVDVSIEVEVDDPAEFARAVVKQEGWSGEAWS